MPDSDSKKPENPIFGYLPDPSLVRVPVVTQWAKIRKKVQFREAVLFASNVIILLKFFELSGSPVSGIPAHIYCTIFPFLAKTVKSLSSSG